MRKFVYPLQYDYLVRQYAYEDKVDPALVASVILVESKFDERAASQPGAHGLMQVMPDTAQWIADEMGMTDYTPEKLNDVRTNIRLGTWYLAYLLKESTSRHVPGRHYTQPRPVLDSRRIPSISRPDTRFPT